MVHAEAPSAVKVGILLNRRPQDLGEWLADAAAFEAAGADALVVDFAPETELDAFAVAAALAAVTFRSLLVTAAPAGAGEQRPTSGWPSPALSRMLSTLERLSHGRLRILADTEGFDGPAGLGSGAGVFRRIATDPPAFEHVQAPDEPERWIGSAAPDSRASWRATLDEAARLGARGLVVPADPRLLDMLRNPGDPGDRRDLQLAQG